MSYDRGIKYLVLRTKELANAATKMSRSISAGWAEPSNSPLLRRFYNDLCEQKKMMEKEFGLLADNISLEEKVGLAMIFAKPRPDYRYGIGNTSGTEGKIQTNLLNIAI